MRFVDRPHLAPHVCAVTLRGATDNSVERWIETDVNLIGFEPHVYLSDVALREGARLIGWFSPDEHEAALERLADLERELSLTKDQLEDADRRLEAVDLLESAGFTRRKKPGRPPKERV